MDSSATEKTMVNYARLYMSILDNIKLTYWTTMWLRDRLLDWLTFMPIPREASASKDRKGSPFKILKTLLPYLLFPIIPFFVVL